MVQDLEIKMSKKRVWNNTGNSPKNLIQ